MESLNPAAQSVVRPLSDTPPPGLALLQGKPQTQPGVEEEEVVWVK